MSLCPYSPEYNVHVCLFFHYLIFEIMKHISDSLRLVPGLVESFKVPVRHHRFSQSRGLIGARLFGAQLATGDVILVLDSHMEITPSFLPPLLNITHNNYRSIAAPVMDFWDSFNDKVSSYDGMGLGFDIYLSWQWTGGPVTGEPFRLGSP